MNEHLNTDQAESNQTKLERSQGAGQILYYVLFRARSYFGGIMTPIEIFMMDFYSIMSIMALGIFVGREFLPKGKIK